MAKDKTVECVPMKQEEDIGFRKNSKGAGAYDSKKEGKSGYPGKNRTSPGRYGSVQFN